MFLSEYKFIVKDFVKFFLLSKYGISFSLNNFIEVSHLILRINFDDLKDEYDSRILDSLNLLNQLSGQQPQFCYFVNGYKKGIRVFRFSCKVTLRNRKLEKFFIFLNENFYNGLKNNQLILNKKFDKNGNCFFQFQSISLIQNLSEYLYLFKKPIFFEIYFKNSNFKKSLIFLNCFKI